jgi:glycosyltransferase involved in cell wall biosynthesis
MLVTYQLVQSHRLPLRSRLINRATHWLFVDVTMAVSGGVATSLAEHSGLDRSRVHVIYNATAPYDEGESFSVPAPARQDDEVRIGYFGRLAEEKGVCHLLEALAVVKQRYPRTRTTLVGDGYERQALEAQAERLGLREMLVFAGYRSDARAAMREMDVIVLPSLIEGLPYVLVEAMEAARPVVATRIPGSSEVVEDGVTGLLVPPADPAALATVLGTLIEDAPLRARLGASGRRRFLQHFDSRRMVERVEGMYDELLRGRPGWPDRPRGGGGSPHGGSR